MKLTFRNTENGLSAYLAKKDMEYKVEETDPNHAFGGEILLEEGLKVYVEPMDPAPRFPITLKVKKL